MVKICVFGDVYDQNDLKSKDLPTKMCFNTKNKVFTGFAHRFRPQSHKQKVVDRRIELLTLAEMAHKRQEQQFKPILVIN